MAENQSNELDIQINSSDIDRTEKKLRGLDRLLEQTRRRAVLLGKTRMNTTITLIDRFSSAAGKISDSLKRLNQTQAMPVVRLGANQAINSVRELRGSLASLTGTPWRVSVAGVDWEVAVGDSFTAWMSSDGKATLQRISSSISKALGDGMKDSMMQSFGLSSGGSTATGEQGTTPGIPTVKQPPLFGPEGFRAIDLLTNMTANASSNADSTKGFSSNGSIYTEAGVQAGQSFFQGFLSTIDTNQLGDKLSDLSTSGGTGKEKQINWDEGLLGIVKDIGVSLITNRIEKFLVKTSGSLSKKLLTNLDKVPQKSLIDPKISPKATPKSSGKWLEKIPSWLSNIGKNKTNSTLLSGSAKGFSRILGPIGATLLLNDSYNVLAELTDFVMGHKEGDRKYRNPVFGFPSEVYDSTTSPFRWNEINEWFSNNKEQANSSNMIIDYSDRVMAPSVQGTTAPSQPPVPKVMGTPISDYYELPESVREKIPGYGGTTTYKPAPTFPPPNPINVTISPGALSLTVNKDEINYKELAEKMGIKLADAMRMAMQNVK